MRESRERSERRRRASEGCEREREGGNVPWMCADGYSIPLSFLRLVRRTVSCRLDLVASAFPSSVVHSVSVRHFIRFHLANSVSRRPRPPRPLSRSPASPVRFLVRSLCLARPLSRSLRFLPFSARALLLAFSLSPRSALLGFAHSLARLRSLTRPARSLTSFARARQLHHRPSPTHRLPRSRRE